MKHHAGAEYNLLSFSHRGGHVHLSVWLKHTGVVCGHRKKELALSSKPWTKCLLGDMKELNIKSIKALEDISKKRELFRIRGSAITQN
mmetsp:Transcript_35440/g.88659  ORF Transcript_35440/g.88659 Transcript_35440/m.88659 type:complete len:88 (+) Transcript_35440:820-1083(+)